MASERTSATSSGVISGICSWASAGPRPETARQGEDDHQRLGQTNKINGVNPLAGPPLVDHVGVPKIPPTKSNEERAAEETQGGEERFTVHAGKSLSDIPTRLDYSLECA